MLEGVALNEEPIKDDFMDEHLLSVRESGNNNMKGKNKEAPWFVDFVNYLVRGIIPSTFDTPRRKRFLAEVKRYIWDEPLLFRQCQDGVLRRCISKEEMTYVLEHCHSLPYGGHHSLDKTASKALQCSFFYPMLFKDVRALQLHMANDKGWVL